MRKGIFVMLSVGALLLAFQIEVLACSCELPSYNETLKTQVKRARSSSQAVFSGTVIEINQIPGNLYVTVKLKVDRSWKGSRSAVANILTGLDQGDCGYPFEVGKDYLVYSTGSGTAELSTNICRRTALLSVSNEDLKILGKGKAVYRRLD